MKSNFLNKTNSRQDSRELPGQNLELSELSRTLKPPLTAASAEAQNLGFCVCGVPGSVRVMVAVDRPKPWACTRQGVSQRPPHSGNKPAPCLSHGPGRQAALALRSCELADMWEREYVCVCWWGSVVPKKL